MPVNGRWKVEIPAGYRIFEREFSIAGVQHYKDNFFKAVKKGNVEFRMQTEPGNRHDPNAIAILASRKSFFGRVEKKVGHVPAEIASQIADAKVGDKLVLRPKKLYISDDGFIDLKFDILGPEQLFEQYSTV
ncbi:HIRAN domain-containing protein [Thioalkalivibrio sp. ALE17]|uniref:HIRAN domain-containing protein n=1 Tax=Thioalkalivibrio sp. ALE17 TaxID=1158173 RepID=UPI00048CD32B|nr:HIRAN domain-containing protein [Thioalkalivibrio sp. ALE17]